MIIDRDAAWRADPKWAEIIDAEIRKGIENIDADTHTDIDEYLRMVVCRATTRRGVSAR